MILISGLINAQITPEFEIGAKGVFSGNLNFNSDESSAVSDFSDTQLLMGLSQKLYNNWRAQFVLGLQFPDANSNATKRKACYLLRREHARNIL